MDSARPTGSDSPRAVTPGSRGRGGLIAAVLGVAAVGAVGFLVWSVVARVQGDTAAKLAGSEFFRLADAGQSDAALNYLSPSFRAATAAQDLPSLLARLEVGSVETVGWERFSALGPHRLRCIILDRGGNEHPLMVTFQIVRGRTLVAGIEQYHERRR